MRISTLANRPEPVTITVDGKSILAHPGESIATALLAAGILTLRYSPSARLPRGAFCLMGVCQECVLRVNQRRVLACQTEVQSGLIIETEPAVES